jgi:hypothetical protein
MSAWQPIATAPKDGTWVLLGGCEYGYSLAVACWVHWHGRDDWCDYVSRGFKPTHWMPLPPPPDEGLLPDPPSCVEEDQAGSPGRTR